MSGGTCPCNTGYFDDGSDAVCAGKVLFPKVVNEYPSLLGDLWNVLGILNELLNLRLRESQNAAK